MLHILRSKPAFRLAILIASLCLISLGSILILSHSGSAYVVRSITQLDKIHFPSINNSGISDQRALQLTVRENKEYTPIFPLAKEIISEASSTESGAVFALPTSTKGKGFSLSKTVSDDTYVKMVYDDKASAVLFQLGGNPIRLDNATGTEAVQVIGRIERVAKDDLLSLLGTTYSLGSYKNDSSFAIRDLRNAKFSISSATGTNIISDRASDFRYGLWSAQPADCSRKASGEPQFAMYREFLQPSFFTRLKSTNHFACTSKIFPILVATSTTYVLSFDYLSREGGKIRSYYRLFSNQTKQSISKNELIEAANGERGTSYSVISTDAGYSKIEVYFYAPSELGRAVDSSYGNLRLRLYKKIRDEQLQIMIPESVELKQNVFISSSLPELTFFPEKTNLLSKDEASFENSTWPSEVQDCCSSDPGVPDLSVAYVTDATDGTKSLRLNAKNHCACVNKIFTPKIMNGLLYRYSFDSKSIEGNSVQAFFSLSGSSKTAISRSIIGLSDRSDWQRQETLIDPGKNVVNAMTLYFYANAKNNTHVTNQFDNLQLETFGPKDIANYRLSINQTATPLGNASTSSLFRNRWSTVVILEHATGTILLQSRSRYASGTKLCAGSMPCIENKYHYLFDDGTEGWSLDMERLCQGTNACVRQQDGTYRVEFNIYGATYFFVRRIVFLLFALTLLSGCLSAYGLIWALKNRKNSSV